MGSHAMLDLSGSLQMCDLLAYDCHSCALKSCSNRERKAKQCNSAWSICMKWVKRNEFTCHTPQMWVRDSTAELYNSRQHIVCLK